MTVYTFTTAGQRLAHLMDEANRKAEVIIKRKNGQTFELRLVEEKGSSLDVLGVDVQLSTDELVDMIRGLREESAQRQANPLPKVRQHFGQGVSLSLGDTIGGNVDENKQWSCHSHRDPSPYRNGWAGNR